MSKTTSLSTKRISRADVRKAAIVGIKSAKADPRSVRLTPGQRDHILRDKA